MEVPLSSAEYGPLSLVSPHPPATDMDLEPLFLFKEKMNSAAHL
jgi:hypothetical protein